MDEAPAPLFCKEESEAKPDELEELEEPVPFEMPALDVEVPGWLCAALLFPCASVDSEDEELLFATALFPCVSAVPDDALLCVTIPAVIFVLFPTV